MNRAAAFYYILGNELPMLRTVRSTNRGKAERLRSSQGIPIKSPESIGNGDLHGRPSANIGIVNDEGSKAGNCCGLIVCQISGKARAKYFNCFGCNVNMSRLISPKQTHCVQIGRRDIATVGNFEHFGKRVSGVYQSTLLD